VLTTFTRKKFFMAILAFEDDSYFEGEAEIALLKKILTSYSWW